MSESELHIKLTSVHIHSLLKSFHGRKNRILSSKDYKTFIGIYVLGFSFPIVLLPTVQLYFAKTEGISFHEPRTGWALIFTE